MFHPRARTMLLLSLPALIIGVASSLVLIASMKVASVFQQFLWQRLPASIGIAYDSPFWIVGMLTLTGIVVGLIYPLQSRTRWPRSGHRTVNQYAGLAICAARAASRLNHRPCWWGKFGARASDNDNKYRAGGGFRFPPVSAYHGVRLDDSGLSGHHRRAIRHARRRSAEFFRKPLAALTIFPCGIACLRR